MIYSFLLNIVFYRYFDLLNKILRDKNIHECTRMRISHLLLINQYRYFALTRKNYQRNNVSGKRHNLNVKIKFQKFLWVPIKCYKNLIFKDKKIWKFQISQVFSVINTLIEAHIILYIHQYIRLCLNADVWQLRNGKWILEKYC